MTAPDSGVPPRRGRSNCRYARLAWPLSGIALAGLLSLLLLQSDVPVADSRHDPHDLEIPKLTSESSSTDASTSSESPRARPLPLSERPDGSLLVRVQDVHSAPIEGALVQVVDNVDRTLLQSDSSHCTDGNGIVILPKHTFFSNGTHPHLYVLATGYLPWVESLEGIRDAMDAGNSNLERTAMLRKGAVVNGQILDQAGMPCPAMDVCFSRLPFSPNTPLPRGKLVPGPRADAMFLAVTDLDGRFRLTGLLPGRYHVLAAGKHHVCREDSATGWSGIPFVLAEQTEENITWRADEIHVGLLDFGSETLESVAVVHPIGARLLEAARWAGSNHWPESRGARVGRRSFTILAVPSSAAPLNAEVRGWLSETGYFEVDLQLAPSTSRPAAVRVTGRSGVQPRGLLRIEARDLDGHVVHPRLSFESTSNLDVGGQPSRTRGRAPQFGGLVPHGKAVSVPIGTYTISMTDSRLNALLRPLSQTCRVHADKETLVEVVLPARLASVEISNPARYSESGLMIRVQGQVSPPGFDRALVARLSNGEPTTILLPHGSYAFELKTPGYEPVSREVDVFADNVRVDWGDLRAAR